MVGEGRDDGGDDGGEGLSESEEMKRCKRLARDDYCDDQVVVVVVDDGVEMMSSRAVLRGRRYLRRLYCRDTTGGWRDNLDAYCGDDDYCDDYDSFCCHSVGSETL